MRFRISAVTAWAVRDLGGLSAALVERIDRIHPKAETATLTATVEEVQAARDALRAFVASGARHNAAAYRRMLDELSALAAPDA